MKNENPKGQIYIEQAKEVLKYLKSDLRYDEKFLPRPFFVEFTGSPSAGKTTTITKLYDFFRRSGFRVLRPQEGAEVIQHVSRKTPLYNIRTGLYALQMLIDYSASHDYDLVIFDRCVFDVYAWMVYWQEKSMLTEQEKDINQGFFLQKHWMDKIDAAFFMICEPQEALERDRRISISNQTGETTNPKNLEILYKRYKDVYNLLSPIYPQLRLIDTTKLGEAEMIKAVVTQIFDAMETKIKAS
ncbi:MAG: AAA family ATPase [Patescibacteria group bacterium]